KSVALTLDAGALDPYDGSTAGEARAIGAWLAEHDLVPVVETGARFLLDPWRKHWPTLLSPRREDRERRIDFLRRAIGIAGLPGEGDLDLAAVVSTLREIDYRGPANLELSRHGHRAVEAARRAIEFFRPLGLP